MKRLIEAAAALNQEVTLMVNDSAAVVFDDERAVANAGVMLPAALATKLGIEALVEECVDLGERPGAPNPGRKTMTLLSAMALGADCIEDCEVLRSGRQLPSYPTASPRPRPSAPSFAPSPSATCASSTGCSARR